MYLFLQAQPWYIFKLLFFALSELGSVLGTCIQEEVRTKTSASSFFHEAGLNEFRLDPHLNHSTVSKSWKNESSYPATLR